VKKFILIAYILLISIGVNAQARISSETTHGFFMSGDLGYSALLHNIQGYPASAGLNTNIGMGYRLFHDNFLFSTGLEAAYQFNANQLDNMDLKMPMRDTEGQLFQMHVLVNESQDFTHMVNLNLPILFGGEWGKVYFLVGPKIAINVYGAASSSAVYTTYGEYDEYYDDFYDMPNHQFESNRKMSSGTLPMDWNMNIMAHLEIGSRVGHYYKYKIFRINPDKVHMYLAAYVDFGVLNIHSNKAGEPIFDYKETEDQGVQFYIQPLLISSASNNAVIRNLNIGIKYTICFPMKPSGKSFIYDWWKAGRDYRKSGGNQAFKYQ
jgi:hypothetical protein